MGNVSDVDETEVCHKMFVDSFSLVGSTFSFFRDIFIQGGFFSVSPFLTFLCLI